MASLSTDAQDLQNTRYILLVTAAVWLWDSVVSLGEDRRTYTFSKLQGPDIGQMLSRLFAACLIATSVAFFMASTHDCATIARAIGWISAITLPLHAVPFFFCARAVYLNRGLIVIFFGVLWVGVLAGNIASPFYIHGHQVGSTSTCRVELDAPYATGIVSVAGHNVLVFLAVASNLATYTQASTWSGRFKAYFRRRGISELSERLMKSGTSYIFPIVIFNIAAATVNLICSIPASYKLAFVVVNAAFQSLMTTRIHRLIKAGVISDHPNTTDSNAASSFLPTIVDFRSTNTNHGLPISVTDTSQSHVFTLPPSVARGSVESVSVEHEEVKPREPGGGV
ncbi:hypothetical protein EIP91_007181 [Steccherinum ochraceum]|uniref:G-protein coupled receptors family 1 profile domain-containing protein n=1 Tax=Steccherinum ochraceum TaxID=92696 RepID=A0A4V2MXC1_9APHY|nr:hypothetical protein EIP91_007181 [Steccherinum ochraceum]